ncbi:serine/threonine-protein kinase ULK3 [Plutella xylostella]|uniref:serine/threonine-protein kinase ULK3 n=1 Tax=Plutella xylostella TaxID=51655 RepID=UPI0020322F7B|nr:serine/threonine-protein kinase ULK3 [Plutella xylostella]
MPFPKIEGYVVTEKLGSGSYSTVYKAYTKVGARSVVAIKCVDKSRLKHSSSAVDNLITEIRLLKTLQHPHIVQMKEFSWDDRNIYIITEYCSGGDLSKYIHKYGRVPERQVLYFLQQLVSALRFLRSHNVVHMDLKPHNLLLHEGSAGRVTLKVADFGFAQYMASETLQAGIRGSPLYMAPEMLAEGATYDAAVDLWSLGVIMYECLFGKAPYSSGTFKELMEKIKSKAPIEIPPKASISPGCRDLLTRLLQHSPEQRITYEELFAHPYLDLDRMPSKQNYEKAVQLIRRAVDHDGAGRLSAALEDYCEGLKLLVAEVARYRSADSQQALTAKINTYMDRAEQIKAILKQQSTPTPPLSTPLPLRRDLVPSCCSAGVESHAYYYDKQPLTPNTCSCGSQGEAEGSCQCGADNVKDKNGINKIDKSSSNSSGSPKPKRFELPRWFRKKDVPYLPENIIEETGEATKPDCTPLGEPANEGCKIT